jgi:hypothetical protein
MPIVVWWILGAVGALILSLCLWLGYRAFRLRRLQPIVLEYLALQEVEQAVRYIETHPQLLTRDAEDFIAMLLDRAWARGDVQTFVSGAIRMSFLVGCREYGTQTARQMALGSFQPLLDAADSPSWQRAMELLGHMVVDRTASIDQEDVDEELVEAMSHIMELLRPLAADPDTVAMQDEIVRGLRQVLRHKQESEESGP